jgi:hypothetical protein
MRMRPAFLSCLLAFCEFAFLSSPVLFGQTECFHTCAPNPRSGTYGANIGAQFQQRNARGMGTPTVPAQKTGESTSQGPVSRAAFTL